MTNEAPKAAKPARTEDELDRMREAHERRKSRHVPVEVAVTRRDDGGLDMGCPHDDSRGWLIRLGDAFGTQSDKVAVGHLNDLLGMIGEKDGSPNFKANKMLASVDAMRPESEIEGQLAVQMATTHQLAMDCLQKSSRASTLEHMEAHGNLAAKLLRTYTAQIEALAKLRRGGAQKVTVEHVHVYEGGQAIVGTVGADARSAPAGGRGRREREQQAHAPNDVRALALAGDAEVWGADPLGEALRGSGGEREETVPDARRGGGKRGAER
ncbi:hypothetical protein [Methylobacterium sp. J-076]|uniref:hypothetical protein n=1 Tax=Methylobacterium sp. J-076 TaxID=2836655 RepID=UPI001FBBD2D4|nr:hypothetical protein [Methylobacterium sp. J-076]MCJ2011793.1 hypothetical protein [Methylobacterium sp. J-076]